LTQCTPDKRFFVFKIIAQFQTHPISSTPSPPKALTMQALFHYSFHVSDLDVARRFYTTQLNCKEGRSAPTWVDFDFFGHQLSVHLGQAQATSLTGKVGDIWVPMPHFGLILKLEDWRVLAHHLQSLGMAFIVQPQCRFQGQAGEQWTMFFCDPFGNPIEIKGFEDLGKIY
jgi:uncharacterized protein